MDSREKTLRGHIASPISNLNPEHFSELYVAIEQIFSLAMPILSKMTRPALILPGKLQAVIKAQTIFLKEHEEYEGVWHRDGKNEDIVAVIIYYYRVSEQLVGGDLEFMDKRSRKEEYWTMRDCDSEDFISSSAKNFYEEIPHCRIPIKTGTLVVFSNYQFIHRVLRMYSSGPDKTSPDGFSSRDFLLFFVVDQKSKLITTNDLIPSENNYKSIKGKNIFKLVKDLNT